MATADDIEWWEHPDPVAMAGEIAGDVAFLVGQAVEGHGRALLALPPGEGAVPLLAALFQEHAPWDRVTLVPTHGTFVAETTRLAARAGATALLLDAASPPALPLDLAWLAVSPRGDIGGIAPGAGLREALTSPHPVVHGPQGACLSASALHSARALIVSAVGHAERKMLEEAIADGAGSRFPAGRFLAEADQAIDLHWCP
ncbi:MAG: hypothetical protein ACK4MT_01065 [Thermaurantiacus tibetensis]|uniref:hypothetical protein n=1 Tax=Thermaurantiacus tibetensis TaxID=2759035 RepID=UPI00188DF1F3|nr:hypothetical protein [Thermaurantiacus tibetensis]